MPEVSVITPLYNYDRYIVDCILSCLCQPFRDIEVIVVDDCSTDRSLEFADMMAIMDKRVRVLTHEENRGYSAAKNTAIRAATGYYIRPLDADDMLTPVGITKPLAFLRKNPDIDMVHGMAYKLDGKMANASYAQALRKQHKLSFDRRPKIHAQAVMYRRDLHEKHGYYHEPLRSRSDKACWINFKHKGVRMEKVESKWAFYRIHNKSMQAYRNEHPSYNKAMTKELCSYLRSQGIDWPEGGREDW